MCAAFAILLELARPLPRHRSLVIEIFYDLPDEENDGMFNGPTCGIARIATMFFHLLQLCYTNSPCLFLGTKAVAF
jgi:hypothetical protein